MLYKQMKIEIRDLKYKYEDYGKESKYALNGISFDIFDNDFLAIVGETGSGKSTLSLHLNGLLKANSGMIYIDGKNIYEKDFDLNKLRYQVALVFQYPEYQLFAETVIDDVIFGALNKGIEKNIAIKKAKEILYSFGFTDSDFNKMPIMLSGGEKRKVAIAGILIMEPEVLILDEPEAGLDPISKKELFLLLKKLHEQGKTIIFITHNLEDSLEYASRVLIMKKGEVIACDETYKIFNNEEVLKNANIVKPEQLLLLDELKKKGYLFDDNIIKQQDIIKEIIKNKNDYRYYIWTIL